MHGAFKACIQCMDFELWAMIAVFNELYYCFLLHIYNESI